MGLKLTIKSYFTANMFLPHTHPGSVYSAFYERRKILWKWVYLNSTLFGHSVCIFCGCFLPSWQKSKRRRFSHQYLGDGGQGQHVCPLSKCMLSAETVNTVFLQPSCIHCSPTHVSVSCLTQPFIPRDNFPDTLKTLTCIINSQGFKEGKNIFVCLSPPPSSMCS